MKSKKIAILVLVIGIILIALTLAIKYYFDVRDANENIFVNSTYMTDVTVLEKHKEAKAYYATIEMTSEDVIKAYKLKNPTMTLKVDEKIYDDLIVNKPDVYIGLSLNLELRKKDVTEEEFNRIKSTPEYALSYNVYYEFFTISKLH